MADKDLISQEVNTISQQHQDTRTQESMWDTGAALRLLAAAGSSPVPPGDWVGELMSFITLPKPSSGTSNWRLSLCHCPTQFPIMPLLLPQSSHYWCPGSPPASFVSLSLTLPVSTFVFTHIYSPSTLLSAVVAVPWFGWAGLTGGFLWFAPY